MSAFQAELWNGALKLLADASHTSPLARRWPFVVLIFGRLRVFDSRLGKTVLFKEYVLESWGWQASGMLAHAGHENQTIAVPKAVNMLAYTYRSLP